jgi:hypothetical protein
MKTIAFAFALCVSSVTSQASWFCSSDTTEFAARRTAQALHGFFISPDDILSIDDSLEAKKRVDAYKTRVIEMKAWAEALSDNCLRTAYLRYILEIHESIIEKDYRAIEFLKTPKPFQPNS